jgi:hypothetical protein
MRDGCEQQPLRLSHAVRSQQEGAAFLVVPGTPRAVVEERREVAMRFVEIADRVLIQDHDVCAGAFEPPVLLGLEHWVWAQRHGVPHPSPISCRLFIK